MTGDYVFEHHPVSAGPPASGPSRPKDALPAPVQDARQTVRAVIVDLLEREGTSIARDPRRVEAFLRDLCGEYLAEISVAMSVLRVGLLEDLHASAANRSQPISLAMARLAMQLCREQGIEDSLARWAVGSWALALGVADIGLVESLDSSSKPAPASASSGPVPGYAEGDPRKPSETSQELASGTASAGTISPASPISGLTEDILTEGNSAEGEMESIGAQPAGAMGRDAAGHGALPATGMPSYTSTGMPHVAASNRLKQLIPPGRQARLATVAAAVFAIAAIAAGIGVLLTPSDTTGLRQPGNVTLSGSNGSVSSPSIRAKDRFSLPSLGTYRYATTVSGSLSATSKGGSPSTSLSTLEIEEIGTQLGAAWTGFGSPNIESDLYDWTSTKIVDTSTEYLLSSGNAESTACVWSPPIVNYQEPLLPGHSWSNTSTCSTYVAGAPATVDVQVQSHVAGTRNITVPFGTFQTVLVNTVKTTTLTTTGSIPRIGRTTVAANVDPTTGIPVSEVIDNQSQGWTVVARLEGFTPLPTTNGG
ncbi:MAG: hypothetical protein M1399_07365 [Actinobacteria bacterium]|nr:hypothetical protein [Actinomycetota bacterium]MCL5446653.1 hypothetical protein [Actinomycetota bacterium]